jgi:hypothetical protein
VPDPHFARRAEVQHPAAKLQKSFPPDELVGTFTTIHGAADVDKRYSESWEGGY